MIHLQLYYTQICTFRCSRNHSSCSHDTAVIVISNTITYITMNYCILRYNSTRFKTKFIRHTLYAKHNSRGLNPKLCREEKKNSVDLVVNNSNLVKRVFLFFYSNCSGKKHNLCICVHTCTHIIHIIIYRTRGTSENTPQYFISQISNIIMKTK